MISRSTFDAIDESRRATSSVTIRGATARPTLDQTVPDLAAGTGDQDDRFTRRIVTRRSTHAAAIRKRRHHGCDDREHGRDDARDGADEVIHPLRTEDQPQADQVAARKSAGVRVVVDAGEDEAHHEQGRRIPHRLRRISELHPGGRSTEAPSSESTPRRRQSGAPPGTESAIPEHPAHGAAERKACRTSNRVDDDHPTGP